MPDLSINALRALIVPYLILDPQHDDRENWKCGESDHPIADKQADQTTLTTPAMTAGLIDLRDWNAAVEKTLRTKQKGALSTLMAVSLGFSMVRWTSPS